MEIMGGQDWVLTACTVRNWNHLTVRLAAPLISLVIGWRTPLGIRSRPPGSRLNTPRAVGLGGCLKELSVFSPQVIARVPSAIAEGCIIILAAHTLPRW